MCAQQKELTAFATMLPSDRRRLVLDLLGVSPVERALAKVREQARDARTAAGGARAGLPDLAELGWPRPRPRPSGGGRGGRDTAAAAEAGAAAALAAAEEATAAAERAAKALEELRAKAGLARAGPRAPGRGRAPRGQGGPRPTGSGPRSRPPPPGWPSWPSGRPLAALEQAREQAAARANLVTALEEAEGRQRTSERALGKAEADAGAAGLVAARVEAEQALTDLDEQLAAARDRHAELSEAAGAAPTGWRRPPRPRRPRRRARPGRALPDLRPAAGRGPRRAAPPPRRGAGRGHRRRAAAGQARQEAVAAGKALAERRAALAGLLEQARAAETQAAKAVALVEAAGAALELNVADVAARRQALDQAPDLGFDPDAWRRGPEAADARQEAALHQAG